MKKIYIARDTEGILDYFTEEPKFYEYHWFADNGFKKMIEDKNGVFDYIQLENSPVCIEIED